MFPLDVILLRLGVLGGRGARATGAMLGSVADTTATCEAPCRHAAPLSFIPLGGCSTKRFMTDMSTHISPPRFHSNVPTNDLPVRKPSTSYWTQVPQTCGLPTRTARHVHRVPRNLTLASRPPMKKVVSLPLYNTAQAPSEELWRETRYLSAV